MPYPKGRLYQLHMYRDKKHKYRWRLVAPNGRIVADSAESYSTRQNCYRACKAIVHTPISITIKDDIDGHRYGI